MRIEVLFPEICNLCGDLMNVRYLQQCCGAEIVETDLKTAPRFLTEAIDLVYIGSTTERGLQLIVDALRSVVPQLRQKIEAGQFILMTGNVIDAFGQTVDSDDGLHIDGLGILPSHAKYRMMNRHNSLFLGKLEDMEIVGFKSLFGLSYDAPEENALFQTIRGVGRNPQTKSEGFRIHNLMATHVTGPLLVMNPPLTKWLLQSLGCEPKLAHADAIEDAYRQRLQEYHNPNTKF